MKGRKERQSDLALTQLARCWRQVIPDLAQAVLAVGENRWITVLPRLSTDPRTAVRLSLATLVGDAGDTRLAFLLAGMLHDQDVAVGDQAEQSLLVLSVSVLRQEMAANPATARFVSGVIPPHLARVVTVGVRGPLDDLCEQAAEGAMTIGEHRRRGPVVAALLLGSRQRLRSREDGAVALNAWLANERHPSHGVLRSVIRWSKAPKARLRALEMLTREHLAVACVDRLLRSQSLLDHELVLGSAHLLARPKRAARLVGSKPTVSRPAKARGKGREEDDATLPSAGAVRQLSEEARRALPGFVMALPVGVQARRAVLDPLLADESAVVRHGACRVAPAAALDEYCFDRDARVACTAYLRWSNAGAGVERAADERVLGLAARSPHAQLRVWAGQDREQAEAGVGTVAGRLRLRREMAADRGGFVEGLRAQLRAGDAGVVLQGLGVVRGLGLAVEVERDLLNLASAVRGDTRVVATAAALLGQLSSGRAAEVARVLSQHADARVRANALEAMAKLARRGVGVARGAAGLESAVVELKADAHHRVRANAIRAGLLEACGAVESSSVAQMLMDARPMHRLAGVWLAGRVLSTPARTALGAQLPEFVARIGELARHDEDPRVRARARACGQRLEAALRATWKRRGSAAGVTGATVGEAA